MNSSDYDVRTENLLIISADKKVPRNTYIILRHLQKFLHEY